MSANVSSFPAKASQPQLDKLASDCITEVAERTGVASTELLDHIVREWYNVQFDITAPELRAAMARSKRDAQSWAS